ncbi:MgtC/SapB family protein [Candidatus Woesearchaeota archaeon]|nr:MgtC/SapB family protein [Candidatus Woesearchaeota archaeon]
MDPNLITLLKIMLSVVLGSIIGYERERFGHYAGIRTHIIVCMTSTFVLCAFITAFEPDSAARVAAAIMTGIGFIGAGTILSHGREVKGLTTAASVWGVAGLGLIIAIGAFWEAVVVTLVMVIILEMRVFALKVKKI